MSAAGNLIGIVLAGGAGSRLGAAKATATLGGVSLAVRVAGALAEAVGEVAVVAKVSTALPVLPGEVEVWREPAEPLHPLAGIAWALGHAGGRAALVCPVDLPFVDAAVLARLARLAPGAAAVVAVDQPLLGRFAPSVAGALSEAVAAGRPARRTIAKLSPVSVHLSERTLFNVNTPEDLARAEAMLGAAGSA